MSTKETGGQAFPAQHFDMVENEHGLTMRDWFAAKAMQAYVSRENWNPGAQSSEDYDAIISRYAYEMADAMLRAREAA